MITINNINPRTGDCEYKGYSIDDKPLDAAPNSLFLELDTGNVYWFFPGVDNGYPPQWVLIGSDPEANDDDSTTYHPVV